MKDFFRFFYLNIRCNGPGGVGQKTLCRQYHNLFQANPVENVFKCKKYNFHSQKTRNSLLFSKSHMLLMCPDVLCPPLH